MNSSQDMHRLRKSRSRKMIAGVCGGIAEYFSIDETIVRLVWVLAALFGGWGLLVYIAAALIMPSAQDASRGSGEAGPTPARRQSTSRFWGVVIIASGILWLAANLGVHVFFPWWGIPWKAGIGVLLVVAGVILLLRREDTSRSAPSAESSASHTGSGMAAAPRAERLSRSSRENVIFGVCGGIADYLNLDPVIVRLIIVAAAFGSLGLVVMIYVILAAVLPLDERARAVPVAS
jgi:phage shock protein C